MNGGAYVGVTSLADDTWYNIWMVSANTNPGTFSLYLQSDTDSNFATQTKLSTAAGLDTFAYRVNGATDIINVYFRNANNAGGMAGNDIYIDDVYINPSASDLTNPAVAVPCVGVVVIKGDVNMSGTVDFGDIAPFIAVLQAGTFQAEADVNCSADVDFGDIAPFITILQAG